MNKKIILTVTGGVAEEVFNDTENVDIFIFDFDGDNVWYYKNKLVEILNINGDGTISVEYDGSNINVEPSELFLYPEY